CPDNTTRKAGLATPAGCSPPRFPIASPSGEGSRVRSACPAAAALGCPAPIRLATPLDPDALPPVLAARVTEQVESGFDPVSGSALARRRRRLGALVLSDRTVPVDPAEVASLLADTVAAQGMKPLKFLP